MIIALPVGLCILYVLLIFIIAFFGTGVRTFIFVFWCCRAFGRSFRGRRVESETEEPAAAGMEMKVFSLGERSSGNEQAALDSAGEAAGVIHEVAHFAEFIRRPRRVGAVSLSVEEIRGMTCTAGGKYECWSCGSQICQVFRLSLYRGGMIPSV
jgi:hypothetical protein